MDKDNLPERIKAKAKPFCLPVAFLGDNTFSWCKKEAMAPFEEEYDALHVDKHKNKVPLCFVQQPLRF